MEIQQKKYVNGAEEAEGLAVVIDVFRASSTITTIVADGGTVIPVKDVTDAVQLKEETGHVLIGERNREKLPDAEYNNSPSVIAEQDWNGKTVILSTSAGTKVLHAAAENAETVVVGCFLNITTVCEYIQNEQPGTVTFVAAGKNAEEEALEDEMCAAAMTQQLQDGETVDMQRIRHVLKESVAAAELRGQGLSGDVDFCLQEDTHPVVPRYDPGENRIAAV